MSYHGLVEAAVDYAPCRYGASRLEFRGPRKRLKGDYIAVLGGSASFGRYVAEPWPELLEEHLDRPCVNFSQPIAGPDVFLNDETVLAACAGAALTVIQVTGAQNLSNRFYSVHPRRNDRFLRASPMLTTVFPEVDFTEFHFTRHMLGALEDVSPERFAIVRAELRRAWQQRMNMLTARIRGKVVLLWIAPRSPDDPAEFLVDGDPPYVTRGMLRGLRGRIAAVVEAGLGAPPETEGMVFAEAERAAALRLPGPRVHAEAAERLAEALRRMR